MGKLCTELSKSFPIHRIKRQFKLQKDDQVFYKSIGPLSEDTISMK